MDNNVINLVPTKSDKELADELRQKIMEVYKPVIEVFTLAKKAGFDINVSTGADGFGEVHLMDIKIFKNY